MENETNIDNLFEEKFMTQAKFSKDIETMVLDEPELNYIDAIVHYCESNQIEIEKVSKLISKPLKEKLRYEAIRLNFLKKTTKAKLPL